MPPYIKKNKPSIAIIRKCVECGTEFKTYPKNTRKNCSPKCGKKSMWKFPGYRENKIKELNEYWTDDKREKVSEFQKELQNRPEVKEKMCKLQKIIQNAPGVNEKRSKTLTIHWSNLDNSEKRLNNSLKYKDYILPSGKLIRLQGNEPEALDILLKTYSEDDIISGVKEMNKLLGKISYSNEHNREHTYFPDFYIPSINTIIEVKSKYTYNKNIINNHCKKQACLNNGYNYIFMIIHKKNKKEILCEYLKYNKYE